MTTLSPNQFFKDSFDSIDSIRVNYSLDIQTCPQNLDFPQNSTTSSLQVEPFIEFKKSGELRLYFRVFDLHNKVSPIIIDSHVSVSHQVDTSMNSQDKDLLDAPIQDDSTPIHEESQQEFRNFMNFQAQQNLSINALKSPNSIDTYQIKNTLPTQGGYVLQNIEKTCFNNGNSFLPYKQKKLGREVEGFKEEFAGSTASQEHSFDNQFLFNISPASLGQSRFNNEPLPPISLNNNKNIQQFKNSFEKQSQQQSQQQFQSSHPLLLPLQDTQRWQNPSNNQTQSNTSTTRKRGQQTDSILTNQIDSELNGVTKKKAGKIEEKSNTAGNCKGNAVNMAKNILKGFMDYVFISAKEEDIVECCAPSANEISSAATASPLKSIAKELADNNEEEDEDFEDEEIQNTQPKDQQEDHCLTEISPAACESINNNDLLQQSSVEAIRKRFRKQYNQKLLEKPSNSKLLKLFANSNYGKLFRHYFSSQEIMNYIESSNIINKFAHKDLVEKIRTTAFDIEKLQDVLKTRIFKRPPFQKPQK